MRKRIAMAAIGAALFGVPAASRGAPDAPSLRQYEARYLMVRDNYVKRFSERAAGRNIVRFGYRERSGDIREASKAEVVRSVRKMRVALNRAQTATAVTASSYSASSATNSTVICESGGDYAANTGNGYFGGYQFDSSTWDAYGDPAYAEASDAPPAVQDAAAASTPYDAWPNC